MTHSSPSFIRVLATFVLLAGCSNAAPALTTTDGGTEDGACPTPPTPAVTCIDSPFGFTTIGSGPFAVTVVATGAVAYDFALRMGEPPTTVEVEATLTAIDAPTSSFVLTADEGAIDVFVAPVPRDWIEGLTLGARYIAHFESGLTLTDASDGTLQLAVLSVVEGGAVNPFDVGPLHVVQSTVQCVSIYWPRADGPTGCAIGFAQTEADVSAGGMTQSLRASWGERAFVVGDEELAVRLIHSTRQADIEETLAVAPPETGGVCAPLRPAQLALIVHAL